MGKKLGILGGMGPLATVKLFENIVLLTEAKSDQEHIHILIDNNISIPDRTKFILNDDAEDPRPQLVESALRLEDAGADFIIMPCNTAHNFYEDIKKEVDIPFLNMIEETAKYVKEQMPQLKKIGLLATDGTIKAEVYNKVFDKYGIQIVVPTGKNQRFVYDLIYNIKEDILQDNLDGFYMAMDEIRENGVDTYIAGCTEISVALDKYKLKGNFIDPLKIISISAIEFAGKKSKKDNL